MNIFTGQTINGYKLDEYLGGGGFGDVYRARQGTIARDVAVKIIRPQFTHQPEFIRRFEQEARLITRLEHMHIVPLYDYWRDVSGAFLVMRWMRGGNLRDKLKSGALPLAKCATIIEQVSSALAFAHQHQIIHRDIKPENILFDEDDNAYLVDFGIAADLAQWDPFSTLPDAVLGSLDYLSPEQARGEPVTTRTDIYCFSIVIYEMLTGQHPFHEFSEVERLYKHINESLSALILNDTDLAKTINTVIRTATQKNPAERYESVQSFTAALLKSFNLESDPLLLEATLTLRQQEVLQCLVDGLTNREIADKLYITEGTVKWYNTTIFEKLNVSNRVQAASKARELHLLERKGPSEDSGIETTTPETLINPYRGLYAFDTADADYYFGRADLVQKLLDRMGNTSEPFSRFLAIIGPSGSGKSSLVKAGLIPALWSGKLSGSENWFVIEMIPGSHPLDKLETALIRVAVNASTDLSEQLLRDDRGLLRTADIILPAEDSELVIVIDQFEEVFTLVEDEDERQHFLNLLLAAVTDRDSRVRMIVTLRADYYDRPLHYPAFGELLQQRSETILPLTAHGLDAAIRNPAEVVGVRLEAGLLAEIVSDMNGQVGALPLLQYALTELFERREGRILTRMAYQQIGRTGGALANRADEIFQALSPEGQALALQLFLQLVTIGEGAEDTRRRVARADLLALSDAPDLMDEIIDQFTIYRFLALDHDPQTRQPTVEVAHEAILREWQRLRGWINAARDDIRQERLIAQAADAWQANGCDTSYLLTGVRLKQVEAWNKDAELMLTPLENEFIQASINEAKARVLAETERIAREEAQEQRSRKLLRALVAVFAIATILSGGFGVFAMNSRNAETQARLDAEEAELQAQTQSAVLLAAQSESELEDGFFDRAVLLALEALENYPYTTQAEHALGQAVTHNRALQRYAGHESAITSADWSPDRTKIATSSTDNTVHIWDATTGEQLMVIELPTGITGNIYDFGLTVKWTPDGGRLLTLSGDRFLLGSQDYDMMVWDAKTGINMVSHELVNQAEPEAGEGLVTSADHFSTFDAIAFAPASGRLATVGGDNTAIIWDSAFQTPELTIIGHENDVTSVAWSPDERQLASGSEDGTARIWDTETGELLSTISGHTSSVNQVAWSPDGSQLATAGKDGTVRFWNTATGDLVQTLEANGGIVWSLAWSPNGLYLATGTNDALVRVWEIESQDVVAELNGHQNFITGVAWSAEDNRLVSVDAVGVAYVWNVAPSTAVLNLPNRYSTELDWSADSRYLALGSGDWWAGKEPDNMSIWDIWTGQPVVQNLGFQRGWYISHPDFSPDGNLLLNQAFKGPMLTIPPSEWEPTTFVINARTGDSINVFSVQEEASLIRTAFWSADGTRIAAGTSLGTLVVWDFQTSDLLMTRSCGNWINNLSWSPDGTKIAVLCYDISPEAVANGRVEIIDAGTGETLHTLTDSERAAIVNFVAWSPDGTRLLTTGGDDQVGTQINPVMIWDTNSGERLLSITRHTGQVWWGSWSPDGNRIATGSTDDTTRIWDAKSGEELLTLFTPSNWSVAVEWSPDGYYLATSMFSFDQPESASIWRVWQSTEELIAYAKDCCVFRQLTSEERAQFGLPLS